MFPGSGAGKSSRGVVTIALGIVGSCETYLPKWFLDVVSELTQIKGLGTISNSLAVIAFGG